MVQLGVNANEAKVFKAFAAPQGLCENLINVLKLLANQQTDGDSPIQSIVSGLQKRSRKGIMDGLKSFIKVDNHSASGRKPFYVQKLNLSEVYPDAIREGADDLTFRSEEVKTLKACINIDSIEETHGDRRWLMPTGMLSTKQSTKELKGVIGKSCIVAPERGARQQEPKS